jgi:hypothetical protein
VILAFASAINLQTMAEGVGWTLLHVAFFVRCLPSNALHWVKYCRCSMFQVYPVVMKLYYYSAVRVVKYCKFGDAARTLGSALAARSVVGDISHGYHGMHLTSHVHLTLLVQAMQEMCFMGMSTVILQLAQAA